MSWLWWKGALHSGCLGELCSIKFGSTAWKNIQTPSQLHSTHSTFFWELLKRCSTNSWSWWSWGKITHHAIHYTINNVSFGQISRWQGRFTFGKEYITSVRPPPPSSISLESDLPQPLTSNFGGVNSLVWDLGAPREDFFPLCFLGL